MITTTIARTPVDLQERGDVLADLHREVFVLAAASESATPHAATTDGGLTDDALLAIARSASNGEAFSILFDGDTTGYKSPSEADLAANLYFAFYTRKDPARMDALFRRSGLMRAKWDEKRGDRTYGQITIQNAIDKTKRVYQPSKAQSKRAASHKSQLVLLADRNGGELFHASDGHPYATVTIGDHRETMSLHGRPFAEWLSREYFLTSKKVVGSNDLKDAIRVLSAQAKHDGPERDVFIRVARIDERIYIDLGRPQWDAVEITRDGWRIVPQSAVKFRRSRGLLPLPEPVRSLTPLTEMLGNFLHIEDPCLLIAWLLAALRGRKPYPILDVSGEQGTTKTSTCRYARRFIDPNTANLRLTPKEPRDLMIAALNSHVIAYDNLSIMPDWLSDALCVLSTGGGFSTRELFSNQDEMLFSAERPILLNGIVDVVTRPDLLDRALILQLEPIPDGKRRNEADLEAEFAKLHPGILAALFDATATALKNEATTKLDSLPRMADFATWMVAAEPALGWKPGRFMKAYRENQQAALDSVVDGDVVIDAVQSLPFINGTWSGLLKDLLTAIPEHQYKPKSPRGLSGALRRKAPALRHLSITITFPTKQDRNITFTKSDAHEHQDLIARSTQPTAADDDTCPF